MKDRRNSPFWNRKYAKCNCKCNAVLPRVIVMWEALMSCAHSIQHRSTPLRKLAMPPQQRPAQSVTIGRSALWVHVVSQHASRTCRLQRFQQYVWEAFDLCVVFLDLDATAATTGWPKNWHIFVRLITSSNIDQFSNFFHCQNQEKICNRLILSLKIPPHLNCVATLPCKMSVS